MTTAVATAIRSSAGDVVLGMIGGDSHNSLQTHAGDMISLNIAPGSVLSYVKQGNDLVIQLTDGQTIRLIDWFGRDSIPLGQLYLSSDGMMTEIHFTGERHGVLIAESCVAPYSDDWHELNGLRFDCSDPLVGTAISGHGSLVGLTFSPAHMGLGFALVGGAVLLGGKGGSDPAQPEPHSRTIDGSGTATTVTLSTADAGIKLSGSGEPGEAVTVAIGSSAQTTQVGPDGRWIVRFAAPSLPEDGSYLATATFSGGGISPRRSPAATSPLICMLRQSLSRKGSKASDQSKTFPSIATV